jgi:hypothetical protein
MGENLQPVIPGFNKSLRVESRSDRLTGDPGAVLLREIMEASGIVTWVGDRFHDTRRQADVVHDLPSRFRTTVLLAAQGWRDHDDADALRYDPAMRLATSSSAGLTPLVVEKGLASQPTRRASPRSWRSLATWPYCARVFWNSPPAVCAL